MSMHKAKAALRQAKNITKGFSDIQVKVREATSNDPWGPSGSQMAELADHTYDGQDFMEIMEMLDKRLNDSGKNWRHVFKALTVLDYLVHSGSEQVVAFAKQNLYVIKTLKEFQYIDDDGRDQGVNVREKSKAIASLLADTDRLKEERKSRATLRDKMIATGGGQIEGGRMDGLHVGPSNMSEEQRQLERALEESRRTAEDHERRIKEREKEERELQRAIEQTRQEQQQQQTQPAKQQPQQSQQPQQQQAVDLWGAHQTDQRQQDLDFFSSMAAPAPVQQSQPDPFGFGTAVTVSPPMAAANLFGPSPAMMQPSASSAFATTATTSSAMNVYGGQQAGGMSAMFQQPAAQVQQANLFGSNPAYAASTPAFGGNSGRPPALPAPSMVSSSPFQQPAQPSFDSAFDTGAAQKSFVPRHLQGQSNPNAQLAAIARNAQQIDPFANLAGQGTPPMPGGSSILKPMQPAKSSMSDLSGFSSGAQNANNAAGWTSSTAANAPNYSGNFNANSSAYNNNNPFGPTKTPNTTPMNNPANDPFASLAPLSKAPSTNAVTPKPNTLNGMNGFGSGSLAPPGGAMGMGMGGSSNFAAPSGGNFGFGPTSTTNNNNAFGSSPLAQPPMMATGGFPVGGNINQTANMNNMFGQQPAMQQQQQQAPSSQQQQNFFF